MKHANIVMAMGIQSLHDTEANIVIMGTSLVSIANALRISKYTLRNITQNLSGAFLYNIVGIPIAAGVFYPLVGTLLSPIIAGALMACSSLGVTLNANRLHLLRTYPKKRDLE